MRELQRHALRSPHLSQMDNRVVGAHLHQTRHGGDIIGFVPFQNAVKGQAKALSSQIQDMAINGGGMSKGRRGKGIAEDTVAEAVPKTLQFWKQGITGGHLTGHRKKAGKGFCM